MSGIIEPRRRAEFKLSIYELSRTSFSTVPWMIREMDLGKL